MNDSTRFSMLRLGVTLSLLLATNLALEIDGFELADAAQCVCEEAELEDGIVFSRAGEPIGELRVREDQIYTIQVEQLDPSPMDVEWSLGNEAPEAEISIQPELGTSANLKLTTSPIFEKFRHGIYTIRPRFKRPGDANPVLGKNLRLNYMGPAAGVTDTRVTPLSTLYFSRGQVWATIGTIFVRIRNSSESREWELEVTNGIAEGLTLQISKFRPHIFEVNYQWDHEQFLANRNGDGCQGQVDAITGICEETRFVSFEARDVANPSPERTTARVWVRVFYSTD